jgi:hypothetical protein
LNIDAIGLETELQPNHSWLNKIKLLLLIGCCLNGNQVLSGADEGRGQLHRLRKKDWPTESMKSGPKLQFRRSLC